MTKHVSDRLKHETVSLPDKVVNTETERIKRCYIWHIYAACTCFPSTFEVSATEEDTSRNVHD